MEEKKKKRTVDHLHAIDISRLKRLGLFDLDLDSFTFQGEILSIVWFKRHLGAKRPFFLCPGCQRRVIILYEDCEDWKGQILCRHCHNLSYKSQNESQYDRSLRKARKIRDRLGASHDLFAPIIANPRGMHWKTFETLRLEARLASARATEFFALDLAVIEKRWQRRGRRVLRVAPQKKVKRGRSGVKPTFNK